MCPRACSKSSKQVLSILDLSSDVPKAWLAFYAFKMNLCNKNSNAFQISVLLPKKLVSFLCSFEKSPLKIWLSLCSIRLISQLWGTQKTWNFNSCPPWELRWSFFKVAQNQKTFYSQSLKVTLSQKTLLFGTTLNLFQLLSLMITTRTKVWRKVTTTFHFFWAPGIETLVVVVDILVLYKH